MTILGEKVTREEVKERGEGGSSPDMWEAQHNILDEGCIVLCSLSFLLAVYMLELHYTP